MTTIRVAGGAAAPEGLVEAVLAYERALVADDLDALADAFEDGPDVVRADRNGLLVGAERIAAFRGNRGGAGSRTVRELHVHPVGDDAAHVTTVNAPERGGRGIVSQLWRRTEGAWRIVAAHVTAPAPAVDPRIWRVVGTPLVAGDAEGDGLLAGETVAVKDLYAIEGQKIGVGVRAYLAEAPLERSTAPAVQALLDAGADVVGIAHTDQFAYSIAGLNPDFGTPPNACVPGAVPGGSSSGPACAVAWGQASVGLGTDTAGSIRIPASYQGLWGLRTTHGAVSLEGVAPLAPSYDTVGWMTRDGRTLMAAARATLDGSEARAIGSRVLMSSACLDAVEPEVRAAFCGLIDTLAAAGLALEETQVPALPQMLATFRVTQSAEAWRADGAWVQAHPGSLAPDVAARFAWAKDVTAAQEEEALAERARMAAELDAALGEDLLVLPTASSPAPSADADPDLLERVRMATLSLTAIAGLTGRPALSVPVLETAGGPVGVCLVGPRGSDLALIEVGLALESLLRETAA